jgi:hypothetical protein
LRIAKKKKRKMSEGKDHVGDSSFCLLARNLEPAQITTSESFFASLELVSTVLEAIGRVAPNAPLFILFAEAKRGFFFARWPQVARFGFFWGCIHGALFC